MTKKAIVKFYGIKVKAAERKGAERGLKLALEHLLQVARTQVPHEEGVLEDSGDPDKRPGAASLDGLHGAVSFDTPYAVRQHEEMDWQHDDGRKSKYLEDPLASEDATMRALIAAQIRREMRKKT
ncbi:hypothetical protein GCM10009555_017430 [Acrocarpospora macrocephala]|uniref:Uncharacterized protein n=1 Tax=Acrocarpospora macrocephala TaxID=150177 RepID=A0A5M3WK29_9ACTN|nr:hypothetical protein [Acrocarpospora macrocephala]GES07403.1 hypothetical protein Amac_009980 [Acrocarpospora macrocephala]